MHLALTLGRRGHGNVWPNPAVGCVLVRDGRVLARGWTQPGGRPHAEVHALASCDDPHGATAYVTLEPCAHHGKTGPCADALVRAGISRCVVATTDPDPRVAGQGIQRLKDAGIDVSVGVGQAEADEDHAGFFSRLTKGRPKITLKLALSADGRIATATGDSQWITGPDARRHVHAERLSHDAVLVGGGTARADNPSLTVRGLGAVQQPVRIVASSGLDFEGDALKEGLPDAPVWLVHGRCAPSSVQTAWKHAGAKMFEVGTTPDGLDVSQVLQTLGTAGLTRVYCEGGGRFAASLLKAGLVDDIIVYSAGVLIGGDGLAGLGALGFNALSNAPRFRLREQSQIGNDTRTLWSAF